MSIRSAPRISTRILCLSLSPHASWLLSPPVWKKRSQIYICMYMTHIIHTKIIQSLSNLNLLLGIKESVGKLLSLSQRTLNDLEIRDVAQEVADWLVWVWLLDVSMWVRLGLYSCESWVACIRIVLVSMNEQTEELGHTVGVTVRWTIGLSIDGSIAIRGRLRLARGTHAVWIE